MQRLKVLRKEARITQAQLAEELCLSQETISGYEHTRAFPPLPTLMQIADMFHTTVDFLLERTDNRNPQGLWESQLSELETELIFFFRRLSIAQKERIVGYVIGTVDETTAASPKETEQQ